MLAGRIEGYTREVGRGQGYTPIYIRDDTILMQFPDQSAPVAVPIMVTAWLPTPEELERIAAGQPVYLTIMGTRHPPVILTGGNVEEGE